MATEVYSYHRIRLLNDIEIEVIPLKIKYLRGVMDNFASIENAKTDDDAIVILTECARIAMQQFLPDSKEDVEDILNMPMVYDLLDYCAGIRINKSSEDTVVDQARLEDEKLSWKNIDLAKLEAEAFLLGIWKNYEELESSLSMPELMLTLSTGRELDYDEKKFLAAIQGVDLDSKTGQEERGQVEWEKLKARVFSGGATDNPNDILSYQGHKARKAGFGVGLGLEYESITN